MRAMVWKKLIAVMKSLTTNSLRIDFPPSINFQPGSRSTCLAASSAGTASTPPSQGLHFFWTSSFAVANMKGSSRQRSMHLLGRQTQLPRHGRHRVNDELNVLIEIDAQIRRPAGDIVAIDAGGKALGFQLLLDAG